MIRRPHIPLMHLVLFLWTPAALAAQVSTGPEEGDRVRFVSDEMSGESRVAALLEESLLLERDSDSVRFAVPTATLERLEVYRGMTSRLKGFLVGSAAGGLIGGFLALPCQSQPHFTCRSVGASGRAALGAGAGALVGAAVWGGREIWEEIRLRGTSPRSLLADRDDEPGIMNTITRDEIAALPDGDAMEIVRRLRPGWLRPRTQATISSALGTAAAMGAGANSIPDPAIYPEVFQGHLHYGPAESLRAFQSNEIERLERVGATEATTYYGTGYLGGIIRVVTRR